MPGRHKSKSAAKHATEATKASAKALKKDGNSAKISDQEMSLKCLQEPVLTSLRIRVSSYSDFENELKKNVLSEYKNFRKICKNIVNRLSDDNPSTAIFPSVDKLKKEAEGLRRPIKEKELGIKKIDEKIKKLEELIERSENPDKQGLKRENEKSEPLVAKKDIPKKKKELIDLQIEKDKADEGLTKIKEEYSGYEEKKKASGESDKAKKDYFEAEKELGKIQNKITMYKKKVISYTKTLGKKEKDVLGIKKKEAADSYLKRLKMESKNFYKNKRQFYLDYEHLSQGVFSSIIALTKLLDDNYKKMMSGKDYKALVRLQQTLRKKKKELMQEEKKLTAKTNQAVNQVSKQADQISKKIGG